MLCSQRIIRLRFVEFLTAVSLVSILSKYISNLNSEFPTCPDKLLDVKTDYFTSLSTYALTASIVRLLLSDVEVYHNIVVDTSIASFTNGVELSKL